jgi:hypothetical protein
MADKKDGGQALTINQKQRGQTYILTWSQLGTGETIEVNSLVRIVIIVVVIVRGSNLLLTLDPYITA